MAQTVKLKRSATPSKIPATTDLALGELAINTYDGKLYLKKDNGTQSIVDVTGGGGAVSSVNGETGDVLLTATDIPGVQYLHGFVFPYEVSLSYNKTNRTITVTPSGATFDVWINGVKYTKTGAQTSTAHTNASGSYFLYYNASGNFEWSTDPWDFKNVSPVAYVFYSTTAADGIALFELHTYKRNPEWHESQHFAIGTFVRSGLDASGYVLNSSTSNADITYQISSGIVVDEDIEYTAATLADGGPYTIISRTGASEFTWTTAATVPFLSGATYIQYNQLSGGNYALTQLATGDYVNYYLFATTAIDAEKRFFIIPGQAVHATLSSAQAESVASLALASFALPESVAVWKFTYQANASYTSTTGRVRLVEVNRITNTRGTLNVAITTTTHNLLTGRDAADAHPATAVSFTPTGNLASTTVAAALAELDSEKQPVDADLTAIAALAGTSGLLKKTAADTWTLDTNTYLTGNQSISISGDASGSGTTSISLMLATVGITKGGTGQTTAAAAFNALSPLTTLGDIIYASGANTAARLAGNTTSTRQFLRQTGTGTVSAAPAWDTVTKTDVGLSAVENTALSTWAGSANITTVGTIATGTWSGTAIAIAKGGTGATTAAAAYNALTPITTLGDLVYGSAANTASRLAGNTTATKQFLSQTGTGTVSAAPAWSAVSKSDVGLGSVENTALSTWAGSANITTLGTIATGTWSATAIAVAKGGTGATTAAAALTNLGAVALAGDTMTGVLGIDMAGNQLYLHNGSASSTPTVIHRNDGTTYYFLLSAAGAISGTWNTLRPLYISTTTGLLASNNGQQFVGGCSIDTLTLTNDLTVANGGTGVSTLTGIVKGNGTSAFTAAVAGTDYMGASGAQDNTAVDANFRVIRNRNSASSNDGLYIGYANTNSGRTRIYGGGSSTNYSYLDADGWFAHSSGVWYVRNDGGSWGISVTGSSASCTGTAAYATAVSGVAGLCGYSASGQAIAYTSAGGPYPQAQSSGAAMMSFHRPSVYGVNFGLDTDNVLKIGGWSMGAVAYPILHTGNFTSTAPNTVKAWVTFNGTTSPGTIAAQYNVTSVTRNSAGDYTINLTNALADANYTYAGAWKQNASGTFINALVDYSTKTSSALRIVTGMYYASNAAFAFDSTVISVTFFR